MRRVDGLEIAVDAERRDPGFEQQEAERRREVWDQERADRDRIRREQREQREPPTPRQRFDRALGELAAMSTAGRRRWISAWISLDGSGD
jgi:hypothetical protein